MYANGLRELEVRQPIYGCEFSAPDKVGAKEVSREVYPPHLGETMKRVPISMSLKGIGGN
jgi:hypothetical protein